MTKISKAIVSLIILLGSFTWFHVHAQKLKRVALFNKPIPQSVDLGADQSVVTRLASQWGLLFVDVTLNGHGPFRFLLDTGADTCLLAKRLVDTLNLTPVETRQRVLKTGHRTAVIQTGVYQIDELTLGEARFEGVPFIASNTAADDFQMLKDLDVTGILGANLFHEMIVTLDLPQEALKLSKSIQAKQAGLPLNENYYLPVVKMTVQEKKKEQKAYSFLIDSGYNGFIKMPVCFSNQSATGKTKIDSYDVFNQQDSGFLDYIEGTVTLGNKTLDRPRVAYTLGDCQKPIPKGLIGTRFLKEQAVSIDQQQRLVYLHD